MRSAGHESVKLWWAVPILLVFFALKWPVLGLPYYWDEAVAYVLPSLWLADHGLDHAFPGRHFSGRFYGHPPVLYLTLAGLYRTFGHSLGLTHAVAVALAGVCLFLTLRVGALLGGVRVGALALAFVVLHPLFFAQAGMMHGDMSVAALGLLAVSFYLEGRLFAYVSTAAVLVLCKETGVAFVAAIAAYHLLVREGRESRLREALELVSPAVPLLGFFAMTWWATGRLVDNSYFNENELATISLGQVWSTTNWLFVEQGRWLLTSLVGLGLVLVPGRFLCRELALLGLVILPFWIVFSVIFFLPRYLLPAFPFLAISAALATVALADRFARQLPYAVLALAAILFARGVGGDPTLPSNFEQSMAYAEVVRVHRQLTQWVASERPNATVISAWPLNMNLEWPRLGYVAEPVRVVGTTDTGDVLVLSEPGDPRQVAMRERLAKEGWVLAKRFGAGYRAAAAYDRP